MKTILFFLLSCSLAQAQYLSREEIEQKANEALSTPTDEQQIWAAKEKLWAELARLNRIEWSMRSKSYDYSDHPYVVVQQDMAALQSAVVQQSYYMFFNPWYYRPYPRTYYHPNYYHPNYYSPVYHVRPTQGVVHGNSHHR